MVFRSIDIDDNGFISRDELEHSLTKIYRLNSGPKAKAILKTSGDVSPADFSHMVGMYSFVCNPNAHTKCLEAMSNGRITKAIQSILTVADSDRDGRIELAEWKAAAAKSAEIQAILNLSFH